MSVYEASITNPKKQLEFYKVLSEQLQKENEQLKKQHCERTDCAGRIGYSEKVKQLEDRINKAIEYIETTTTKNDELNCTKLLAVNQVEQLLEILKGKSE